MGMTVKSELDDNNKILYKKLDSGEFSIIVTNEIPKDLQKYSYNRLFEEDLCTLLPKNHKFANKNRLN